MKKNRDPQAISDILKQYQAKTDNKYISKEFQDYAYRLAMDLGGQNPRQTISMCMRLVKNKPRGLIESAHQYVRDAKARNKIALFLWKLKELEKESQAKKEKKAKIKPEAAKKTKKRVNQ